MKTIMNRQKVLTLAVGISTFLIMNLAYGQNPPEIEKNHHKYAFVDKSGKEIILLNYDKVSSFSEGLAVVIQNNKSGFIDKTGKEVIPIKYDKVSDFSDGLSKVILDGKLGCIDKTGREVIPIKYSAWFSKEFSEGVLPVSFDGKYGYVDKYGNEITPIKYDYVEEFSEGLAAVKLDKKWGYIDKSGKVIIPLKYDVADPFKNGFATIKIFNKSEQKDLNVAKASAKTGLINKDGETILSPKYTFIGGFSNGVAPVFNEVKNKILYGYITEQGKEIVPVKYESRLSADALLKQNNQNQEIGTSKYETVSHFSDDLYIVKLKGKMGVINETDKIVIPIEYDMIYPLHEGLARFKQNNRYGFMNIKGEKLQQKIFSNYSELSFEYADDFSEGFAIVKVDNYYGCIDKTGKMIIKAQYELANKFSDGFALVKLKDIDHKFSIEQLIELLNNMTALKTTMVSRKYEKITDNSVKEKYHYNYKDNIQYYLSILTEEDVKNISPKGKNGLIYQFSKNDLTLPEFMLIGGKLAMLKATDLGKTKNSVGNLHMLEYLKNPYMIITSVSKKDKFPFYEISIISF
jgi:hypothetical protein